MTDRHSTPSTVRLLWIGDKECAAPEHAVRLLPPLLELLPEVELMVVGSATDQSAAGHLATDLGIADRIVIPDPAASPEHLMRGATIVLVSGNSQDARPVIDLATARGVPTIACTPSSKEAATARQGTVGYYTAQAREIASLLQDRAANLTEPFGPAIASRELTDEADVPPPARPGIQKQRAVPDRPHDGSSHLLGVADPRRIPDRIVRLGAGIFDRAPRTTIEPIRTLDFSTLGLGDTLMAWAGLHALLHGGYRPVAPGCAMYVQQALVRVGTALFAGDGVRVLPAGPSAKAGMASPILTPESPKTWRELYRGTAGPDWRVNCFPAIDAQKAALRSDYRHDPWERFCLGLTERLLHRRRGWQAAPAEYVGFRIWMPVARRMGLFPVTFLALFKQSLPYLRGQMRSFVEALGLPLPSAAAVAIFPTGRSYQAFPADFCRGLRDRLQPDPAVFYVAADDPWIGVYRDAGLDLVHLDTLEELLWVLRFAPRLTTTDSFASHAAQLLRDDFQLVLTRDIRENILHPGANPTLVTNHPRCAPCHYVPRVDLTTCPARYDRCIAFENKGFLERIVQNMREPSRVSH